MSQLQPLGVRIWAAQAKDAKPLTACKAWLRCHDIARNDKIALIWLLFYHAILLDRSFGISAEDLVSVYIMQNSQRGSTTRLKMPGDTLPGGTSVTA